MGGAVYSGRGLRVRKRAQAWVPWEVRAHAKNAIGPLRLTREVAAEIGASPVVVEAAETIREEFQRKHPIYPFRSGEAVGLIRREMQRLQDNDDLVSWSLSQVFSRNRVPW